MAAPSEMFPMICAPNLPRATAFLVKLTDSSLKSLHDSQRNVGSVGAGDGGKIVIAGNEGRISFTKGGDSFRFTMSDVSRDLGPQGLQEVVRQNSDTGLWQLIGSVTHRMQILATDDTYQSTKRKALQAEEEAKKVSAKVLKQPKLGASKASNKIWQKINQASAATAARPLTPVRGSSNNNGGGLRTHGTSPGGNGTAESNGCSSSLVSVGLKNHQHHHHHHQQQQQSLAKVGGVDITKKTLRQRIIQHLVVRPSSPSDLLSRMCMEGLTEAERQCFSETFDAVAEPSPTGAANSQGQPTFRLRDQCLSEVTEEWPSFTGWEKTIVRRALKGKMLLSSSSKMRKSALPASEGLEDDAERPPSRQGAASRPSAAAISDEPLDDILSDRSRHARKGGLKRGSAIVSPTPSKQPALDGGSKAKDSRPKPVVLEEDTTTSKKTGENGGRPGYERRPNAKSPVGIDRHDLKQPLTKTGVRERSDKPRPAKEQMEMSLCEDGEDQDGDKEEIGAKREPSSHGAVSRARDVLEEQDSPQKQKQQHRRPEPDTRSTAATTTAEWLATLPEIRTLDERRHYKEMFDQDYPVYMKTYEKLRSIAAEFDMLGKKLGSCRKGSDEYRSVERDICVKYRKFYEDGAWNTLRQRHERLRSKLAAIKDRVTQFDQKQTSTSASASVSSLSFSSSSSSSSENT